MIATFEIVQELNKRNKTPEVSKLSCNLEDAKIAARRLAKRAGYAADDLIRDLEHGIRHNPLRSLGIAFGVGATTAMAFFASLKTKK